MAIKKFRHKGLKKYFQDDDKSGLQAAHIFKIGLILLIIWVSLEIVFLKYEPA